MSVKVGEVAKDVWNALRASIVGVRVSDDKNILFLFFSFFVFPNFFDTLIYFIFFFCQILFPRHALIVQKDLSMMLSVKHIAKPAQKAHSKIHQGSKLVRIVPSTHSRVM